MDNEEYFDEETPILVLVDEEGQEHLFELLAEIEIEETKYRVLVPVVEEEEDIDEMEAEVVLLKVVLNEAGEEMLSDIEDDEEWEMVADTWQELLAENEL